MEKLSDEAIDQALLTVPEWAVVGEAIQRTFQFKNFRQSMAFVMEIATRAEATDHHPDILIRYSRVTLTLQTHDAGGITEKDFGLARQADEIGAKLPSTAGWPPLSPG